MIGFATSSIESSYSDYNSYNRVSVNINGDNNQVNVNQSSYNKVDDYTYKCKDCYFWIHSMNKCYILPNNSNPCSSFITTEDYKNEERAAKLRLDSEYIIDHNELREQLGYKPLDNTKVKLAPSPPDPFQSLNLKPRRWTIRFLMWCIKIVKWSCGM